MKKLLLLFFVLSITLTGFSQRRMENLDRGLIASMLESGGVYLSWRITGQEWFDVGYNLYRNGDFVLYLDETHPSNYIDTDGTADSYYEIEPVYKDGSTGSRSPKADVYPEPYFDIELAEIPDIAGGTAAQKAAYTINDMTAADLTGDGQYELIVKRVNTWFDSSNPAANPYHSLFEAYRYDRDSKKWVFMWRIDLGPNVFNDVEINLLAFDFDGDGKAEVITRTSEGTKDATGYVIPDMGDEAGRIGDQYKDNKTDYRYYMQNNSSWYEYAGPEFISLFDGETGKQLDMIPHIARNYDGRYTSLSGGKPIYGEYWGDGHSQSGLAHRALKFFYGAPYLDGKKPSFFTGRGIYHNIVARAYDILPTGNTITLEDGRQVKELKFSDMIWRDDFVSADHPGYTGQGYHNYSIADVDNDGCDEIIYGSMTISKDGKPHSTTGLGHGDAIHVGNFDPYRKGIEVWNCLENSPYYGSTLRAAEDNSILLQKIATGDEARAVAGNFTGRFKGAELFPAPSGAFSASERRQTTFSGPGVNANFRIYWDGDLLDDWMDRLSWSSNSSKAIGVVYSYNDSIQRWENILTTTDHYTCNHSKTTPSLQADLFGDWREELILRNDDDTKIRVYFTQYYTPHRIYTLMHDMQYRQAIAWQMMGYNQPPHKSYFLGEAEGIVTPPPPLMSNGKLVFQSGNEWDFSSSNWDKDGVQSVYTDGQPVLFDYSIDAALTEVSLAQPVKPDNVTVYTRKSLISDNSSDYKLNVSGSGKMTGDMRLVKQGGGTFTLNGTHDYTGTTEIWDGTVVLEGELTESPVWMYLFGELAATGTLGKDVSMNYASVLYPGGIGTTGTLSIGGDLNLRENSIVELDISNSANDKIAIGGKLNLTEEKAVIRINTNGQTLNADDYILMEVMEIEGDLSEVSLEGLGSQIGKLSYNGTQLILTILDVRAPATITWTGKESDSWDVYESDNFAIGDNTEKFVTGDVVVFDGTSSQKTVVVSENLAPAGIIVDSDNDITISAGDGKITGDATLTKQGSGKLTMTGINDFTGKISVLDGTLEMEVMPKLVNNGSIGIVSDDTDLFYVDGATITYTGDIPVQISRAMSIGNKGATIQNTTEMLWYSPIAGADGVEMVKLIKSGRGNFRNDGNNSTVDTLYINGGTVTPVSSSAKPAKVVVLGNGTELDDVNRGAISSDFVLQNGATAAISMGNTNTAYTGKLTGSGNLDLGVRYVRENLEGDWSAFDGKITVKNKKSGSYEPAFRVRNNYGMPKIDLYLEDYISVNATASDKSYSVTNFEIGSLGGVTTSSFEVGGSSWIIGTKNTDAEFAGVISGSGKITKAGTGNWLLANTNTYSATTDIAGGRIVLKNSVSTTGTGAITVAQGAVIGGIGTVNGAVTVSGIIEPGNHANNKWAEMYGTLTFAKNVSMNQSAEINISLVNSGSVLHDKIIFNGSVALEGNLVVEQIYGSKQTFAIGTEIQIFEYNGALTGSFRNIELPPAEEGGAWDTSTLYIDGKIRVSDSRSISSSAGNVLQIQPNPAEDYVKITLPEGDFAQMQLFDMSGNHIQTKEVVNGEDVDVSNLTKGVYVVRINIDGKVYVSKLVKK